MEDLGKLDELINRNKHLLTLVEGKKDVISLKKLGFKKIRTTQMPIYKVIDSVNEEVQILTDLDSHGKRIFCCLRHHLQRKGIKINNQIRIELFKTKMRTVEGLYKYMERRGLYGRKAL